MLWVSLMYQSLMCVRINIQGAIWNRDGKMGKDCLFKKMGPNEFHK